MQDEVFGGWGGWISREAMKSYQLLTVAGMSKNPSCQFYCLFVILFSHPE